MTTSNLTGRRRRTREVLGRQMRRRRGSLGGNKRLAVALTLSRALTSGRTCALSIRRGKIMVGNGATTNIFCNLVAFSRLLHNSTSGMNYSTVPRLALGSRPHACIERLVISPYHVFIPCRSLGTFIPRVTHCGLGVLRLRLMSSRT